MKLQVWYMKPTWFPEGIAGRHPVTGALENTHTYLKDIEADTLEDGYAAMQGERWSPNGEASGLIRSKGLLHTSMSVGDVFVEIDTPPEWWLVKMVGFVALLPPLRVDPEGPLGKALLKSKPMGAYPRIKFER